MKEIIKICNVCGNAFIAPDANKRSKRRTCSKECSKELERENRRKDKIILKGIPLLDLVKQTINELGADGTQSVKGIVWNNKILKANDSHKLRAHIGNIMKYELGYTKISNQRYKKLL